MCVSISGINCFRHAKHQYIDGAGWWCDHLFCQSFHGVYLLCCWYAWLVCSLIWIYEGIKAAPTLLIMHIDSIVLNDNNGMIGLAFTLILSFGGFGTLSEHLWGISFLQMFSGIPQLSFCDLPMVCVKPFLLLYCVVLSSYSWVSLLPVSSRLWWRVLLFQLDALLSANVDGPWQRVMRTHLLSHISLYHYLQSFCGH